MAIRATCPNGHEIKAKNKYAGRLAKCPHCGEPVRIPVPNSPKPTPSAAARKKRKSSAPPKKKQTRPTEQTESDSEWDDLAQLDESSRPKPKPKPAQEDEFDFDLSDDELNAGEAYEDEFEETDEGEYDESEYEEFEPADEEAMEASSDEFDIPPVSPARPKRANPLANWTQKPFWLVGGCLGGLMAVSAVIGVAAVMVFSMTASSTTRVADAPIPKPAPRKDVGQKKAVQAKPKRDKTPSKVAPAKPPRVVVVSAFDTAAVEPLPPQKWPGTILGPFKDVAAIRSRLTSFSASEDGERCALVWPKGIALFGPQQWAGDQPPVVLPLSKDPERRTQPASSSETVVGWLPPSKKGASWTVVLRASQSDDPRILAAAGDDINNLNRVLVRLQVDTLELPDDGLPSRVVIPANAVAVAEHGTVDRHLARYESKQRLESGQPFPAIEVHWRSGTSRFLPRPISQQQTGNLFLRKPIPPVLAGTLRRETFPLSGGEQLVDGAVDGMAAFAHQATPNARFVRLLQTIKTYERNPPKHSAPGRLVGVIPGRRLVVSVTEQPSGHRERLPIDLMISDELTGTPVRSFRLPEAFAGRQVSVLASKNWLAAYSGEEWTAAKISDLDLPDAASFASDVRVSGDRQPGRPLVIQATPTDGMNVAFVAGPDGAEFTRAGGVARAEWTPTISDIGDVDFVLRHTAGVDQVDQTVRVTVGPPGMNLNSLGLYGFRVIGLTPDGQHLLAATVGHVATTPNQVHQVAVIDVASRQVVARGDVPNVVGVRWFLTNHAAIAVEVMPEELRESDRRSDAKRIKERAMTIFRLETLEELAKRSIASPDGKVLSDWTLHSVSPGSLKATPDDATPSTSLLVIETRSTGPGTQREILKLPSLEPLPVAQWLEQTLTDDQSLPIPTPRPGGYEFGPFALDADGELAYLLASPLNQLFVFGSHERPRSAPTPPDDVIMVPGSGGYGVKFAARYERDPLGRSDDLLARVARVGSAPEVLDAYFGTPLPIPAAALSYASNGWQLSPKNSLSTALSSSRPQLLLGQDRAFLTDGVHVIDLDLEALAPSVSPPQGRPQPKPAGQPAPQQPILHPASGNVELQYALPSMEGDGEPVAWGAFIRGSNLRFFGMNDPYLTQEPGRPEEAKSSTISIDMTPLKSFGPFKRESRDFEFPKFPKDGSITPGDVREQLTEYLKTVRPQMSELLGQPIQGVPVAVNLSVYVAPPGESFQGSNNIEARFHPLNHTIIVDVPEKSIVDAFKPDRKSRR